MADNKRLRAIALGMDSGATPVEPEGGMDETFGAEEGYVDLPWDDGERAEERSTMGRFGWAAPALAIVAVLAWTAFFAWVNQAAMLGGASPAQWSRWIADWSTPVVLIVGLWLLAMRTSRREAGRFAVSARALATESQRLEERLSLVNRELSLARDFIAAQSRDLESLGRVAAERLSHNADRLQGLIRDNGEQVEAIGRVSGTALANMDRLRDDLPVISNSARDVASQIGNAGEVARAQLAEMIGGFGRLNEFGDASGRQVAMLRGKVEEAVAAFEDQAQRLEEVLASRFGALAERSGAFRADLDGREVEAFAALRRRANALAQELAASAEQIARTERDALTAQSERVVQLNEEASRVALHLREGEAEARERWSGEIVALEERMVEAIRKIGEIDSEASAHARQRAEALHQEAARLDEALAQRVAEFDTQRTRREREIAEQQAAALAMVEQRFAAFDAQATERQQEQLAHSSGLAERSEALAARLRELGGEMDRLVAQGLATQGGLTDSATGLAARLDESRVNLLDSETVISRLTDHSVRLLELIRAGAAHAGGDLPTAVGQAEARLTAFEQRAAALTALMADAGERGAALAEHVASARGDGAATLDGLATLESRLSEVAVHSDALARSARDELSAGIASLQQASREALEEFQHGHADAIRALAARVGSDSSAAIAEALRGHADEAIAELEQASRQASEAGRATALQLRDQLARVNELAGNLEQRVARAREQAEENVNNDFARRMALITESLNSSAIDISKAFANEVTDTAWASYLRGDRGIFTRRAVRLLDNHEARAVAGIYDGDADFRETVNRYIHDFEAMLRSVLSTRDGHTLAVTLISSDMGKLYVALAQAIERLRG